MSKQLFFTLENLANSTQSTLAFSWVIHKPWISSDPTFNQRQKSPGYGTLNTWYQALYSAHAGVTTLIHTVGKLRGTFASPRRRRHRAHGKSCAPRALYPQARTQCAVIELPRHSARTGNSSARERFHTWTTRQNCRSNRPRIRTHPSECDTDRREIHRPIFPVFRLSSVASAAF